MTSAPGSSNDGRTGSAFAPFRVPAFSVLWTATVLSNIGTWMMATGSAWLMTTLSPSPLLVAAVQAASTAPIFLFALLAGALSDLFDKRRLLLVCQSLAALAALGFAVIVASGLVDAVALLVFTFLMASAAAFVAPAWQAIVPRLVERPLLPQAIALNSMGINVARAIGPAIAGALIINIGVAAPFFTDAASFAFIIAALLWWRSDTTRSSSLARETVPYAMAGGLRFAANSPELKAVLVRAAGFFLFASAFMSLLPIAASEKLDGDASTYGMMMAAVGGGAVAGALGLPLFRRSSPAKRLISGTLFAAAGAILLGLAPGKIAAICSSAIFGAGWIIVLSTLNTGAQAALPDWVRARGLALFAMVFSGAMAMGSLVWGAVAEFAGLTPTLIAAGTGGILASLVLSPWKLADGSLDLAPAGHWPEPHTEIPVDGDRGPALVTIEYRAAPGEAGALFTALSRLEGARRRAGATFWCLAEDVSEPGRILEVFVETSWIAHLRHHERVSAADAAIQQQVRELHVGPDAPLVTHWLAPFHSGPATRSEEGLLAAPDASVLR